MKVLVVDDDVEKVKSVATVLAQSGVERHAIHAASTCADALSRAATTRYDLAIVDIVLPLSPDGTRTADAGIDLIRKLSRQDSALRPKLIAAITAQNRNDEVEARVAALGAVLLRYSLIDTSWAEGVQALVSTVRASLTPSAENFGCLACVICALAVPESRAVQDLRWDWTSRTGSPMPGDFGSYLEGKLPKAPAVDNLNRVVLATPARMGVAATTALALRTIVAFRPRLVVMVGIAAGTRGESQIGDVICADPVFEWGSGKWVEDAGTARFEPAIYQYSLDGALRGIVQRTDKFDKDLARYYDKLKGGRPDHSPRLLRGVVATGPAVVAAEAVNSYIHAHHRKVLGIDMETYGIFQAADESPKPKPRAVGFKSVVDFADARKGDSYQEFSARAAACALETFLRLFVENPNCW